MLVFAAAHVIESLNGEACCEQQIKFRAAEERFKDSLPPLRGGLRKEGKQNRSAVLDSEAQGIEAGWFQDGAV